MNTETANDPRAALREGERLVARVWNIALAAVLVAAAFDRSGGKRLVEESSTRARKLRAAPRA